MAEKKQVFDFNFKEENTSEDYQKIIIEQNHTIIRLLSLTTNSIEAVFNKAVVDEYAKSISRYVEVKKPIESKKEDLKGFVNQGEIVEGNNDVLFIGFILLVIAAFGVLFFVMKDY